MALVQLILIERILQYSISKIIVSYARKNCSRLRPGLPMEQTQVENTRSEVQSNHMLSNDVNRSREPQFQKSSRRRCCLLGRLFW